MRPNWQYGKHPPACTCDECNRSRLAGLSRRFRMPRPRGGCLGALLLVAVASVLVGLLV